MVKRDWLLWDGQCGMCSHFAGVARRRDTRGRFEICAFQHCPTPPMTAEIMARCKREMVIVTASGEVLGGADAVLYSLHMTGGSWGIGILRAPPFIWLARIGYRLVATNRSLISKAFFGKQACGLENRMPSSEVLPPSSRDSANPDTLG